MHRGKHVYELDMVHGSLLKGIAKFSLPLIATSILQLLYNAADVIVVGRFAGSDALAAVGSTGALINLIVNVFLGLSIGTNVLAARDYGAGQREGMQQTVHTSIAISIVGGFVLGVFGFIFGGTFLSWMDSPPEVLPLATLYIKIYFIGMPFNMLYNFGAAILRAVGDTKRPLYFLTVSGIVNVLLNLLFVIVFHMGVAGVALATIISQVISSVLVVLCLIHSDGFIHLDIKKLRIHGDKLLAMAKVGLPAGLQGALFSISNVLIQSTVNSYGATILAGNSASQNIEGFIYAAMNAFHQAVITFVSTNIGAGKNSRVRKSLGASLFWVTVIGAGMGLIVFVLMKPLLSIYSPYEDVVAAGMVRLRIFALTYFICGLMDVICGALRGMGASIVPMIVSILGVCGFRIFWIYVILPLSGELEMLYYSYPVSWILTGAVHLICTIIVMRRFPVNLELEAET